MSICKALWISQNKTTEPIDVSFRLSKSQTLDSVCSSFMQTDIVHKNFNWVTKKVDEGVETVEPKEIWYCQAVDQGTDETPTPNLLAQQFLQHYNSSEKIPTLNGPVLVGYRQNGRVSHFPKELINYARQCYWSSMDDGAEGKPRMRKRTRDPEAPKKPRNHFNIFSGHYAKQLKEQGLKPGFETLTKEAKEAWNKLTAEEKQPYFDEQVKDKLRYEEEYKAYRLKNPLPPKKPSKAYHWYFKESKKKDADPNLKPWREMSAEEKKVYETMAIEDQARYEREDAAFKQHCEATGKNYYEIQAAQKPTKKRRKTNPKAVASSSASASNTTSTSAVAPSPIPPLN